MERFNHIGEPSGTAQPAAQRREGPGAKGPLALWIPVRDARIGLLGPR